MSNFISDSENCDHVTILLARVCAARLDTSVAYDDFVRMVARLVDVAVAEAVEDADPRGRITVAVTHCSYCHEAFTGPQISHQCERMRELGLDGQIARADVAGEISRWTEPRSTGATEDKSKAEQNTPATAASETSVAPSTNSPPSEPGSPGAALPSAASAAATHRDKDAPGPSSQSAKRLTPEQVAELRAAYDRALEFDGELPVGWCARQAKALGVSESAIWQRAQKWAREEANGSTPPEHDDHRTNGAASAQIAQSKPNNPPREHAHSHACWCRQTTCNKNNPWCAIKKPGSVPSLAGLQDRPPRVGRYMPGRVPEDV